MTCDETRIEAFLGGEMSDAEERAFDEHLLTCESCWSAVQEDRAGRLALERLRVPAPIGMADRVTASIDLAGRQPPRDGAASGRHGRSRRRVHVPGSSAGGRIVIATAVVVAVVAAVVGSTLGWVLDDHSATDPPQIAKVVAMTPPKIANSPALRRGEHFDFAGQSLTVRSYRVDGVTTLVATSAKPFPMPATSHLVAGSSPTAWMGTDDKLSMYGVNRPVRAGRESMFLVAAMPMTRLPQVAAQLHLI